MSTTTQSITINPKTVEADYGIPVGTLANMRSKGTGPTYLKVGAKVLYNRAAVEAWLESQAVQPVSA